MIQVCLNGTRSARDGAAVPLSPAALAESAAAAVAAGAAEIHVHPKAPCGSDSLSPGVAGPALEAIRAAVRVPVGVTTGAWPVLRLARRLGLDTRIGLEDVLLLPDGRRARCNAQLVTAALACS